MRLIILVITILLVYGSAMAEITEKGRGMLFGQDHAFYVTASSGWVLDNQSGVSQGLHMVFYPVGETWANSPVIIYGRSVSKKEVRTIDEQVKKTVKDFQGNSSPNYRAKKQQPLVLSKGKKGEVYFFEGDQWGNYEAVVYMEEKETINFLVFNARTEIAFQKYLKDFKEIAYSYENGYSPSRLLNKNEADQLKKQAEEQASTPDGKEYEGEAIGATGQRMANFMHECTTGLAQNELAPFNLFIRIDSNGNISEIFVYPRTSLSVCFNGLMNGIKYPLHKFGSFLLNIDMNIKP